jgi:soluble lytic murein transglycosylase-like protein
MNLSFVPGLVFLAILVLSSFSAKNDRATSPELKPNSKIIYNVDKPSRNEELDYKAIYKYIRQKYQNITENDAKEISKYLVSYGKKHELDPKFAAALIARESAFDKEAISSTGAKGLGQLKKFNFKPLKVQNPHNIKENVSGTVQYLKQMLSNWKNKSEKTELALASYYKGYGAVKRNNGDMDKKTRGYVNDILKNYRSLTDMRQKIKQKIRTRR